MKHPIIITAMRKVLVDEYDLTAKQADALVKGKWSRWCSDDWNDLESSPIEHVRQWVSKKKHPVDELCEWIENRWVRPSQVDLEHRFPDPPKDYGMYTDKGNMAVERAMARLKKQFVAELDAIGDIHDEVSDSAVRESIIDEVYSWL